MVTIHQSLATNAPAYNDLTYVVSSSNVAQQNFRFVADIYISGVTGYFRQKKAPHPTYSTGIFDIHRIMENYVSHDIDISTYSFQRNTNSFRQYQVKFGEEYGISSGITVNAALTTASSGEVFNAALGFIQFKNFNIGQYRMGGVGSLFLTAAPSPQRIKVGENAWLHMIQNTSGNVYYAQVSTYTSSDGSGSALATYRIINPYPDSDANINNKYLRFGSGTNNLPYITEGEMLYPFSIAGNGMAIINNSVNSYSVKILNASFTVMSETRVYKVERGCSKYDEYRLHFLNKLGGFDSFTFNMITVESTDISRTLFKKSVGTATATTFTYDKSDKENQELSVSYQDSILFESDWITETEGTWLEELVHSPVVFIDDVNSGLLPINITKVRHVKRKANVDKIFNLQIEAKYSHNNFRQRG